MKNGILFISPSVEDAGILSRILGSVSIPLRRAEDLKQAVRKFLSEPIGAVLTEAHLADGDWIDVLKFVRKSGKPAAVVVTHRFADGKFWEDVLGQGAYDLLPQPFSCEEVQRILLNALAGPAAFKGPADAAFKKAAPAA